jgi:hypothetical protein
MNVEKVRKLIRMLSSDRDGEVVAAARALLRSLEAEGESIHDLAHAIDAGRLSETDMRLIYDNGFEAGRQSVENEKPVASGLIVDARAPATSPIVRGAGNAAPSKSSDPERNDWPTSNSGNFPIWGYSPGQSCKTVEGKPGKLCPHPSNSSILICMPDDSKDAATVMDATTAYYAMVDAAKDEWRRYGPRPLHDCGCHGVSDQPGNVPGFVGPPQKPWITGQSVGQECMTDDKKQGRLALENGRYVCRAIQNGDDRRSVDAAGRDPRDVAYEQMVADAQTAWRRW